MAVTTILQNLDAAHVTMPGTESDRIGLANVTGFEVWLDKANRPEIIKSPLTNTDAVESWMAGAYQNLPTQSSALVSRLLVGHKIIQHDQLRPSLETGPINFSRAKLAANFDLPYSAIDRMSNTEPCYLEYPGNDLARPSYKILVVGGCTLLHTDALPQTISHGVIIFQRSAGDRFEDDLFSDLEDLSASAAIAGLVPYLFCKMVAEESTRTVQAHQTRSSERALNITRYGGIHGLDSVFFDAHRDAQHLDRYVADLLNARKLVSSTVTVLSQRHPGISDDDWNRMQLVRQDICCSIQFIDQIFQNNNIVIRGFQEQITRQMQTASNLLAYLQQTASIQLAEASQSLAEDAKRDGTSMKTLAIVTMLYLPCIAASSILAMPLFDWDRDGYTTHIADPRLWIFFAVTIPLTLLTIGIWWHWQRRSNLKLEAQNLQSTKKLAMTKALLHPRFR